MKNIRLKFAFIFSFALLLAIALTRTSSAAPTSGGIFSVNSVADDTSADNVLTLREAIYLYNYGTQPYGLGRALTAGEMAQTTGCVFSGGMITGGCGEQIYDTIVFNLPGPCPCILHPTGQLPALHASGALNGYSQAGAVINSSNKRFNAKIMVELRGDLAGDASGLAISYENVLVSGLAITHFQHDGIGITRNEPWPEDNNFILGNRITQNGGYGVYVTTKGNWVGGTYKQVRNLIGGNGSGGVYIAGGEDNHVYGNLIGVGANAKSKLGNNGNGIEVIASNSEIASNRVAYNKGIGIAVPDGTSNRITQNLTYTNKGVGISLAGTPGGNQLQKYPALSSALASNKLVSGKLKSNPNTTYTIEFFKSSQCDSSNYGEGQSYLGYAVVTTNGKGIAKFGVVVKSFHSGEAITATAADPNGNTSQFSKCKTAQ